jgi:hypothetical protein
MPKRMISDNLAQLGGADLAILRQVPGARTRFIQMASVLLTTAGLAVLSMSFALHDGLKLPWGTAVPFGLLWGFIILNLDRFLVVSMGATRDVRHLILMATPRLALAAVLALVISTPLVLRVFASDIKAEVYTMQLERSSQQGALQEKSKEQAEANQMLGQISQDQSVLNGNLPQNVGSPALQTDKNNVSNLQQQQTTARRAADSAREAWQCELYGGPRCDGASGVPGDGPVAQAKHLAFEQAESQLQSVNQQLSNAEAAEKAAAQGVASLQGSRLKSYQQAARAQLPELESSYHRLEAFLQREANNGTNLNQDDTGLLAQLQALAQLSKQSSTVESAHLVVGLLFFLIEVLPVTVKILLNLAPPSTYDTVAAAQEDEIMDKVKMRRIENRRIEESNSQARMDLETGKLNIKVSLENDMRTREEDLGKKANEHVAKEMTAVLDLALREWSEKIRAKLAATPLPGAAPSSPGPVPVPRGHAQANGWAPGGPAPHQPPPSQPAAPVSSVQASVSLPDEENL